MLVLTRRSRVRPWSPPLFVYASFPLLAYTSSVPVIADSSSRMCESTGDLLVGTQQQQQQQKQKKEKKKDQFSHSPTTPSH